MQQMEPYLQSCIKNDKYEIEKFTEQCEKMLKVKKLPAPSKSPNKRRRNSSILEMLSPKRPKLSDDLNPYHFYWCKARGFNWFPAILIDKDFNDIPNGLKMLSKPSQKVLDLQPKNGNYQLIAYIEKRYPLQWVQSSFMVEMFVDEETDKHFLEDDYQYKHNLKVLKDSYKEAKSIYSKIHSK